MYNQDNHVYSPDCGLFFDFRDSGLYHPRRECICLGCGNRWTENPDHGSAKINPDSLLLDLSNTDFSVKNPPVIVPVAAIRKSQGKQITFENPPYAIKPLHSGQEPKLWLRLRQSNPVFFTPDAITETEQSYLLGFSGEDL